MLVGIVCGASVCMLIEAYAIRCLYAMYIHTCAGNGHVDEHTCIRVCVCMQATPTSTDTHAVCCVAGTDTHAVCCVAGTDTHAVCCVAGNGHVDCATILLRVGANVNHQNNHGLLLSIYVHVCIYVWYVCMCRVTGVCMCQVTRASCIYLVYVCVRSLAPHAGHWCMYVSGHSRLMHLSVCGIVIIYVCVRSVGC